MTACQSDDKLELLILKRLSRADTLNVEEHLRGCHRCRAAYEQEVQYLDALIGSLKVLQMADPLESSGRPLTVAAKAC